MAEVFENLTLFQVPITHPLGLVMCCWRFRGLCETSLYREIQCKGGVLRHGVSMGSSGEQYRSTRHSCAGLASGQREKGPISPKQGHLLTYEEISAKPCIQLFICILCVGSVFLTVAGPVVRTYWGPTIPYTYSSPLWWLLL